MDQAALFLRTVALVRSVNMLMAQVPKAVGGTIGEGGGLGPFAGFTDITKAMEKFAGGFSAIVGFMTVVAGLFFIFQFVIGAIQWIASGGDKAGLQQARDKITNSLIGLTIVVVAIALISAIGTFLGLEILNPAKFIEVIKFK